jgi:hypothetical protein
MSKQWPVETLLVEAQQYVKRGRGKTVGVDCPCCGQLAKIYKRPITKEMAGCLFQLIHFYMRDQTWIDAKRLKRRGGDYAKLAYWGLIEFSEEKKPRCRQNGTLRPTKRGVAFALGRIRLPSHALVYNKDVVGFLNEKTVGIRDVKNFDYDEVAGLVVGADLLPFDVN